MARCTTAPTGWPTRWRERGVKAGEGVGVMCRDHRGFIDASVALAKLGADTLYLNTGFAAPQLADVMQREDAVALIYDQEFEQAARRGGVRAPFRGLGRRGTSRGDPTLESLIEEGDPAEPAKPAKEGRIVILTSGTTGAPKGAPRKAVKGRRSAGRRSSPRSRCGPASAPTSPRRCSTRGAWPTSRSPRRSASTVSMRRKFDPEERSRPSTSTSPPCWPSCR